MTKLRWAFACLLLCGLPAVAQSTAPAGAGSAASVPPPAAAAHNRISIDVLVTDKDGKPVSGLEPFDFKVLDDQQPSKILAFRRTDGLTGNKFDPPVELIILIDAVNLSYQAITLQRLEVEKFLRLNNGQLTMPTSVFIFSSTGLNVQPTPSKDGNALAAMLDKATGTVRARGADGGVYSLAEQFQDSFKTMQGIAENEARKPGRKILVWIGPGWPLLTERFFIQTNESRPSYFHELVALTKQLREARVTVYNVAPVVGVTRELYKDFLKPVTEPRKMEIANLALEVLAVKTGGRVLTPSNDMQGLILNCQNDVGTYYTLTFAPPPAAHADEYHGLQVQVDQPGTQVRTDAGYYNEP